MELYRDYRLVKKPVFTAPCYCLYLSDMYSEWSAKPLFIGSIPIAASSYNLNHCEQLGALMDYIRYKCVVAIERLQGEAASGRYQAGQRLTVNCAMLFSPADFCESDLYRILTNRSTPSNCEVD
jgi:hypothetical protein